MRLTVTVIDPEHLGTRPRHVTIEAAVGTPFAEVRTPLAAAVGWEAGSGGRATFSVGGVAVRDEHRVGELPLVRGALLTVTSHEPERPRGRDGRAVELRVVSGNGAGRLIRLGRGGHLVGRAASADVRLDDPGVSRAHAVVDVSAEGVRVRDLGTTNPSRVDGVPLPTEGATLGEGQHLRLGSTTVVLGAVDVRPGHHEIVDGRVRIHRRPRFVDPRPPATVTFPTAPTRPEQGRMPLLASSAPLVLSAVLAVALSSPALLLFALMSPVLLLGQWWSDRRAGRTTHRRQLKEHAAALRQARRDLELAARDDAGRRRREHPDLGHVEATVRRRATRLWERRPGDPDHLVLRLGTARQPARVELQGDAVDALPEVDDVPALVDLGGSGVVGIAGPRRHALPLAGGLALQVAAWHTPRRLSLHVLAASPETARDWEWAAQLPHAADADEAAPRIAGGAADVGVHVEALRTLVESRRAAREERWTLDTSRTADVVVVLDGASALRAVPGVSDLLVDGPPVGLAFLCVDDDVTSLPTESRAVVEVDATGLRATMRAESGRLDDIVPDLPSLGWLEGVCRAMAPLVDATPDAGSVALPRAVSFVGLHRQAGVDAVTPEGLAASWAGSSGVPSALVGRTPQGQLRLDLAVDGPHVLIGGTTGSGKSELLQTLVTGLAVANRPDDLSFVLVDYKGGSAFSDCARLPHTVGLVTDLDAGLTARALTSLDAEMKRRERLLAEAGAKDLDDFRRAASVRGERPSLGRLVIVVDEFKALADEFPDFVSGLVRVAALGRSLGLHLVLATQRPAGIVSADMRANVALRIALRVRDRSDSVDVIDAPDAASLDPRSPGRAWIRAGDDALTPVQAAYLGGTVREPSTSPDRPRVVCRDLLAQATFPLLAGGAAVGPASELTAVVDAAVAAAARLGIAPGPPPWLPPLPSALPVTALPVTALPGHSTGASGVPLGVADLPSEQRREPYVWQVGDGQHLGLAGGPRSGRSTTLVALALGLAQRFAPTDVHVHVLQGTAGPCLGLRDLPHVGTVADGTDAALCRRLIARLGRLVDGAVDGEEQRARHTIVLVDGWDSLEESLGAVDHGATVDALHRLLRDGPSAGVQFVVAGGRAVVSGRLPGLLARRLVLQMPDPLDLVLAGLTPAQVSAGRPAGRAVDVLTGQDVQLAHPGAGPSARDTSEAIDRAARALRPDTAAAGLPWQIRALPDRVGSTPMLGGPDHVVLGVGGDAASPLALPLGTVRRLLVAGPGRSGRSSALVTIGEALVARGRSVLTVCPRRSPLSDWARAQGLPHLSQHDAAELVAARRLDPDLCLLVDDAEAVDGSPVEAALVEATRLVDPTHGLVAVGADLARANAAFRGLVPEVARDGCGLLLQPSTPTDGDVLGTRLDVPVARRPGRGYLVLDGAAEPVQVGLTGLVTTPLTREPALPV
ncbi:FtsK/SpoIIIE domain-containing protein [Terrabacter koreensis]